MKYALIKISWNYKELGVIAVGSKDEMKKLRADINDRLKKSNFSVKYTLSIYKVGK